MSASRIVPRAGENSTEAKVLKDPTKDGDIHTLEKTGQRLKEEEDEEEEEEEAEEEAEERE
jgi:hypothetical protein